MARKRSRTREARQRRQQQRRKNQRLVVLVLIVAAAVLGIAVFLVSNQPVEAHIPDDLSARYQGIERGFSSEGYPRLGSADAPVEVREFASFACPGCEALHKDSFDALLQRVNDEQVRFTYVPLNTGSIPNAEGASRAALCAGRQGQFWEMHDALFDWQTRYGNTAFSQNRLLTGVEKLGLSGGAFTACFNSAAVTKTLDAAVREEVATTPTLRVNGVTVEASQAGSIPSSATILQAIDDATPDDWWTRDEEIAPEAEAPPDDAAESETVASETAAADIEEAAEDDQAMADSNADDAAEAQDEEAADAPDVSSSAEATPEAAADSGNDLEDSAQEQGE